MQMLRKTDLACWQYIKQTKNKAEKTKISKCKRIFRGKDLRPASLKFSKVVNTFIYK